MKKGTGTGSTMRRLLCGLLACLLLPAGGTGEEMRLFLQPVAEVIRPGKAVVIRYMIPDEEPCDLVIRGEDGIQVSVVSQELDAGAGEHTIHWNGTWKGIPAPEGSWLLCLETENGSVTTPVEIGKMAPCLIGAALRQNILKNGQQAIVDYYATEAGRLRLTLTEGNLEIPVREQRTEGGEGSISFSFHLTEGTHQLLMTLIGEDGTESERTALEMTVVNGADSRLAALFTPAHGSPWEGKDPTFNYWTAPMDISDEKSVWKILTAPMTVIDNGQGERGQIILRASASADSEGIGTITCDTQGVHVLQKGEEWSLVECYSASFFDSPILNWNALVQGYVPTKYLKEVIPNQEMGYVIDKLTQRMYIFMNGHLFTTLQVSTGLANSRQPYNETRSGEYLMTSKVGTFTSDNLNCGLAIRFNKGDLIHEVPYIVQADGTKSYRICEPNLGSKASHGCVRVQRKQTPEGVNMAWIWANHKKNSRIIIWEDWQGRQIKNPPDDLQLYYNPKGGTYYHRTDHCSRVARAGVTFQAFSYSELDMPPYSKLAWCEYCVPALRKAEIESINALYEAGGDHDPIMTEARKNCPRPLKK